MEEWAELGNCVELGMLFVRPDFQHHGVGSACLRFVEHTVARKGKCGIYVEAMDPAVPFYWKQGFGSAGVSDDAGNGSIVMFKLLHSGVGIRCR